MVNHYERTYGVVAGARPMPLAEFIAALEPARPWSVFRIQMTEATMREEGARARAYEAGLDPLAIEDALAAKSRLQAWRR